MNYFWPYARRMLNFRRSIGLALFGAVVSAVCFGGGIMSVPIILKAMLGDEGQTLAKLATEADQKAWGWIPDDLIARLPEGRFEGVLLVLGVIFVLTIIGATAKFIHTYYAMDAAMRSIAGVRRQAFAHIVHLPMRTVVHEGTVDQISRIVRDSNQLRNGLMALLGKAVGETLKGIVALGVAFWFSWPLTLMALIGTPLLAFTIRKFSKRVQKASRRALVQSASLLGTIMQSIQGLRVVKVHTAEEREVDRFDVVNRRLLKEELSMRQAKALASPVVEMISMMGVLGIAALASWHIITHEVDSANVLVTLLSLGAAGASLRPVTQLSTDIHESSAAAERLTDLLGQEVEKSCGQDGQALPPHAKDIVFEGVSLTYRGATRPALDGIDLTIRAGETVAFVGPNGSGKTTLLSLIPRLFEANAGRILIDGQDIRQVSLRSVREQIGVVTQETVIFNDTIAANIAYGTNGITQEKIEETAKRAHADAFIRTKPDGYHTVVGEQGATLSGGERQRLAIARAILRDPRILILDEATSMIDAESEALIAEALADFCQDRTSLIIAHRLSTVINADRIVVLNAGRIVDIGTHHELLDRCDLYQQLCRTQLGGANGNGNGSEAPTAPGVVTSTISENKKSP